MVADVDWDGCAVRRPPYLPRRALSGVAVQLSFELSVVFDKHPFCEESQLVRAMV
jgi:hypothetical protein